MSYNCPFTQSRVSSAVETLKAIRYNQDCLIELDRLDTPTKHEIFDDLASAIAYAEIALGKIKAARIPT